MPGTNDGTPTHNLDSLHTLLRDRRSEEDAKTLARAALHALGFGSDMDGQVNGVIGVQAKHSHRIGKLEEAVVALRRWHWLFVLAGLSIVAQTAQGFWDRYADGGRAAAQPAERR